MTEGSRPTVDDVYEHHRNQVNNALRRPGMYGGELAHRLLMKHLAFVDGRTEHWQHEEEALRQRGAFNALGVRGAFDHVLPPGRHDDAVASVYADIAHRFGWLTLDRTLTHHEYRHLTGRIEDWCSRDTFFSDVLTTFGTPSILSGGTNPRFPKTIAYAAAERNALLVSFHFWNDDRPDSPAGTPSPIYPEPVLLCVRHRPGSFHGSFTYTPEGISQRPSTVDSPQDAVDKPTRR